MKVGFSVKSYVNSIGTKNDVIKFRRDLFLMVFLSSEELTTGRFATYKGIPPSIFAM